MDFDVPPNLIAGWIATGSEGRISAVAFQHFYGLSMVADTIVPFTRLTRICTSNVSLPIAAAYLPSEVLLTWTQLFWVSPTGARIQSATVLTSGMAGGTCRTTSMTM